MARQHKKKKTTRRKTSVARKSQPKIKRSHSLFWRFAITFFLGSLFAISVVLIYLDHQIMQRFKGTVHAEPAHVYSRPLSLSPDQLMSIDKLTDHLTTQGYRSVSRVSSKGEFVRVENQVDVFLRDYSFEGNSNPPNPVRITFNGKKIESIIDHATAKALLRVLIEPSLIGTLQLGPFEDRIKLRLDDVPENLIFTLLAMEDRHFRTHAGVDLVAISRALIQNIKHGKAVQGGSTITQQLVKNIFLSSNRTLSRKALEALMALVVEFRFDKSTILELYLNEIFLGQSGNRAIHGFALASEYYFGRPISQLNVGEIATLVGLIPAPSYYNPRRNPERATTRRNIVLKTLVKLGAIDSTLSEKLQQAPLGVIKQTDKKYSEFPAFLEYLQRQLRQHYSDETLRESGLRLETTIDPEIQRVSQRSLTDTLDKLEIDRNLESGKLQGSVIVVDINSAEILALVGDRKPGYSGFNRAIDAERPVGSLMKPVIYLSALEHPRQYNLSTPLLDTPLEIGQEGGETWNPENYDKQFRETSYILESLILSLNVPTVRLGMSVGIEDVIETIHRLGVSRDINPFPSLFLGSSHHSPLEITQLYHTIANRGVRVPLRSVREIKDADNQTIARFMMDGQQVIDSGPAYLIDFALKQVVSRGTAARLNSTFTPALGLAGKTGTTDNYRDSWYAGYSGNILTVVWVGRDDNKPIGLTGSRGAMVVWESVMKQLSLKPNQFTQPNDIAFETITTSSGLLANDKCNDLLKIPFIRGHEENTYDRCAGNLQRLKSWFNISSSPNSSSKNSDTGSISDDRK